MPEGFQPSNERRLPALKWEQIEAELTHFQAGVPARHAALRFFPQHRGYESEKECLAAARQAMARGWERENPQPETRVVSHELFMNTNNPAIECIGLKKAFGNNLVLQDISFSVNEGRILALVGPNGAGKTTLLKIFASLIIPTGGKALVCGHDVMRDPIQAKRKIGFVPSEERSFYWRLSGRQNLRFFASLHNIHGNERNSKVNATLGAVGLEDKGNVRFKEYSSGMKQALGIARGILHDPPVLLLDEPTRSLSPDVAKKIRELIHQKAKDEAKTVLISSHNLKEVEELADRIAVLHHGTIKALGSLNDLKTQAGLSQSTDLDTLFEHFTNGY